MKARLRVAVVGAGISGLSAAWLLRHTHDVTLFEQEGRPGGHADTQDIAVDGVNFAVDTGFIVYNATNYPNLTGLFAALGVNTAESDMSFGVSVGHGRLEYGGGQISQLFAQRRNLVRPRFWFMLRDLLRFYREAPGLLAENGSGAEISLGAWLRTRRYGDGFIHDHLLPMGAAIWSASIAGMADFPAQHFARFFHNHGLLSVRDRPQWRTVQGGSRNYVQAICAQLADVRLASGVSRLRRVANGVVLSGRDGAEEHFDQVILACHADQALALLGSPTQPEQEILGAIRCQDNIAVLHTDKTLMPRRRSVWSAWNYLADTGDAATRRVSVTYWMNKLQPLPVKTPVLVSLNPLRAPAPGSVLAQMQYRHPQFDGPAMVAQARLPEIQGSGNVWYAGAWTGWGFHEDGIASAVRVAAALGVAAPWAEIAPPPAPMLDLVEAAE